MVVVAVLAKGSYHLRHLDRPNGVLQKVLAEDMFLLPKSLQPCKPYDSMEFRYLHFDLAPQLHPLKDALGIDSYNSRHLGPSDSTITISEPMQKGHVPESFQSIAKLSRLAASSPPPNMVLVEPTPDLDSQIAFLEPAALAAAISASQDKLFFIAYSPAGTLRKRWYLVRPDVKACAELDCTQDYATTGKYVVDFFTKF